MELHSIIDVLKTGPETAGLKLGDVLRVKVLAVEEGIGRALVEIGRLRAGAEVRFPVTAGEELWVKVTEAGSRLRLQLVRTPAGGEGPPGRAPDPPPPLREGLPEGAAAAGRGAPGAPATDAEPRAGRASEAVPMLPFFLAGPEGRPAGALKVACRPGRSADPGEGHRVSLLLALDRLGAVRADLLLIERRLSVAVFVSDPGTKDAIDRHGAALREALAGLFEEVAFRVSVSRERIARFALEQGHPGGEGKVDLRV